MYGRRDSVPERSRRVALRLDVVEAVAEPLERRGELVERLLQARRIGVAIEQEAIRRVAERRLARGLHVVGVSLLAHEPAVGLRVVRGPCVPHGGGDVEEVPCVDRRCRRVALDRVQQRFVPDAGDRMALPGSRRAVVAYVVGARRAAAERARAGQADEQDERYEPPHGASTSRTWFASTFSTTVSSPPGQRTRTSGTESASPSPKWRRGSSDER